MKKTLRVTGCGEKKKTMINGQLLMVNEKDEMGRGIEEREILEFTCPQKRHKGLPASESIIYPRTH